MNRDSMNVGRCSRTLLAACAGLGWAAFGGPTWAQGVDVLGATKQTPNYVTDDMLLNADKDSNNWLLYGRDYSTTRYAPIQQIDQSNVHKLVPKWQLSFGPRRSR